MINAKRRTVLKLLGASISALSLPQQVFAQGTKFPNKTLTIVVPFGPGSGSDVYARYFAEKLSKKINQAIVIENRPGGGGTVGALSVLGKEPDGHTIFLGSNSPMAVNVSTHNDLRYDPQEDFIPLCGLTRTMAIIVVPKESPIQNISDLIERGKNKPILNMGTYTTGYQLGVAGFLEQAGFNWQYIPYQGLSQTTSDLIGNQIDVAVIDTPSTTRIVQSGQIRALAVTGLNRHPELPDVPTLLESGFTKGTHYSWTALWLKKGTPEHIVNYLAENLLSILNEQSSKEYVTNNSGEIMPFTPKELKEFQQDEILRFAEAAKILNFKRV